MQNNSLKMNAFFNSIRTFVTIIFPIITFPYITRVLGVENIGGINFANSIVSYFAMIAALGISNYSVRQGASLRNNRSEIEAFISQIFSINLVMVLVSYIFLSIIMVTSGTIRQYADFIIVQSLTIFFSAIGVEWIYTIYEDFFYITIRTIVVQVLSLIALFLFVRTSRDQMVYIWITAIGNGIASVINFFHAKKYIRIRLTSHLNLKQHILPMLILGCNTIAITIYVNSDITILKFMQNDYYVGIYSTSVKIYTVIKQVLNALIIVTVPRLSLLYGEGKSAEYNNLLDKIAKVLIVLVFPVIVGVIMTSNEIVLIIAGEAYRESVNSLRMLSIATIFSLMASFFTTSVLLLHKEEKYILLSTIVSAAVNVGLNFLLIPIWKEQGAAFTTIVAEFIVMLMAICFSRKYCRLGDLSKTVCQSLAGCIGIMIACLSVRYVVSGIFLKLLFCILLSVIIYVVILYSFKNEVIYQIFESIKKLKKVREI